MGYVYRFLDKDFNVIYVGRTLNIKSRMNSHFGSGGHLPSSVYQKVVRIDYMETKTQGDMKIKELYYISKYQPKYNTVDKGTVSIQLDELQDVWVSFKKDDVVKEMLDTEELIKSGKEKNRLLSKKNRKLLMDNERMSREKSKLKSTIEAVRSEKDKLTRQIARLERKLEVQAQELSKQQIGKLEEQRVVEEMGEQLEKLSILKNKKQKRKQLEKTIKSAGVAGATYVGYEKMKRLVRKHPEMMMLRIVDGNIESTIRAMGNEIVAIDELHKGEGKSVVMESPNKEREQYCPVTNEHQFISYFRIGTCEQWLPILTSKPYRKPVLVTV